MKIIIFVIVIVVAGVGYFIFRKSEKPQRQISFEIQVEGILKKPASLSLVNNDRVLAGMGPVRIQSEQAKGAGLTIITEPTLISRDSGSKALVIVTDSPNAQVFELASGYAENFQWSPWLPVTYFENSESAEWNFMNKINTKRITTDPQSPPIKVRYKVEVCNVEKDYEARLAATEQLTSQEIIRLRSEFSKGNRESVCQLVVLDPHATKEEFLNCKTRIENQKDIAEKWKLLNLFMSQADSSRSFVSWYNDQYSVVPKGKRDWANKKNSVPAEHQIWFLTTFFDTWIKSSDTVFFENMANIRHCIENMSLSKWSDESFSYIRNQLPKAVEARLKSVAQSAEIENWQDEIGWLYAAAAKVKN